MAFNPTDLPLSGKAPATNMWEPLPESTIKTSLVMVLPNARQFILVLLELFSCSGWIHRYDTRVGISEPQYRWCLDRYRSDDTDP